jgi:ABC-type Mn2+/Zn2+ transport system ATPase subunit
MGFFVGHGFSLLTFRRSGFEPGWESALVCRRLDGEQANDSCSLDAEARRLTRKRRWRQRLRERLNVRPEMTAAAVPPRRNRDMGNSDWVFKADNLTLGYGHHVLFRKLSLVVGRGEILGVVGPNGSGKSTLLRTLLGLLAPLEGQVATAPGLRISYAPQRGYLDTIAPLTALDVVLMERSARAGPFFRVRAADRESAMHALTLLGVQALAGRLFRSLSGGEQQRVRLARALAADPDVLVLDEPTAGMDVKGEVVTIEFLRSLNRDRGVTILIVTHALPIVLNLATSIVLVGARRILYGSAAEVLREDRLAELYGVPVHVAAVCGQRTLVAGGGDVVDV